MNLFELYAKISVDDTNFKKSMENAQKVSKNVATAMQQLQSPLDKAKNTFNAIAHPIETAKANFEKLKNATEAIRHPIETLKNKVNDASTALETKRNKLSVLASGYDSAKKKVEGLTKEFNKSAKESGTSSQKTQELAKKLNEAEKEAEEAKKELDDYSASVSKAGKNSDSASKSVGNFASKLGKGIATAGKIGLAAVGTAAAGITALTTQAVNSFAEYEQLAGGAQKIFNDMDYSKIATDANNAYKELGLSANQYLAVINDVGATFAATMGDEAGYEAAKTGLKAISDYASGTGKNVDELSQKFTLITRSTSSYQSIADQFSGILPATSDAFLEQAQAAGILSDEYTKLTEVPIDEYQAAVSKMLEQGVADLGLAGNTAAEAMTTISGSLAMTKASWSNLVTGLADDSADLDMLIGNFVESVGAVATNLIPKIGTALNGASKLVRDLIPVIVQEIPVLIEENLPVLASAAVSVIQSLADGISQNSDLLVGAVFDAFESIISEFPTLIESFTGLIPDLLDSILEELPGAIDAIVTALTDGGVVENLTQAVVGIVQSIADNLPNIIQSIVDAIPRITESVNSAILNNFPALLQAIIQIVLTIVQNLPSIIQMLVDQIGPIVSTIVQVLMENFPTLLAGVAQIIFELVKAVPSLTVSLFDSIISVFEGIGTGIVNAWPKFKEGLGQILDKISAWFSSMGAKFKEIGSNIISGIKQGISNAWNNLKTWFRNLFGDLIGIAKKILGIASPSKVFKKIGGFTAEGFGTGFEDEFAHVKDDMEDAMNFDDASVGINASIKKVGSGVASGLYGGVSYGDVIINIDGAKYSDEQSLAEAVAAALQNMTDRRTAVYA